MTRTRLATTSAAAVLLGVGLLTPTAASGADATAVRAAAPQQELSLESEGSGVAVHEQKVTAPRAAARTTAAKGAALPAQDAEPFSQVAVTWLGEAGDVEVRTRAAGTWSAWQELEPLGDGPDGPEMARRQGSDLLWVGEADGVQLRVNGAMPTDLRLVLQRPENEEPKTARGAARTTEGADATASTVSTARTVSASTTLDAADASDTGDTNSTVNTVDTSDTVDTVATTKRKKIPRPGKLQRRKTWNPNKKWLNGKPTFNSGMKQVHIHHTASSNDYTQAEVPGIIRGMQRYHTQSLGWFDIGYNFLVDKYGGMWVGRKGGAGKLVRGAHTLGFNHDSTGIAVIGNYQSTVPTKRVLRKISRIAAWKIDRHNAPKARGKVKVTSTGSDRFRSGQTVRLPAIDGHRDTNHTACPGEALYERLPTVRGMAQRRLNKFRS